MYWELVINNRHDGDSLLSGSSKIKNELEIEFDCGIKVSVEQLSLINFEINESEKASILGNVTDYIAVIDLSGIVLSQESKSLFDSNGINNIQYIKTQLNGAKNKYHQKKYFIGNILSVIDCIDYEESDLDLEDGYIDDIYSLILDENKIEESLDVFRLKGSLLTIIVSDNFKKSIEKSDLTGFLFRDLKTQELVLN